MTDHCPRNILQRVLALRSMFSKNKTYRHFEERFRYLLDRRRAELEAGVVGEARCIALIGASGCGKTTAAEQLFSSQPDLVIDQPETSRLDVASLQVPSPATLKFVGQTTLMSLGFPLRRDRTAQTIWDMVKDHLRGRQTLFLHYDEAQDLSRHQTPKEMNAVVSTLKSLLQHKTWPVGLILTGTPELKKMINHDSQLARRVYPIEYPQLNAALDTGRVCKLLSHYAEHADLPLDSETPLPDLAQRLIHAADREFGLLIEMLVSSLEEAMTANCDMIRINHFAAMFRKRTGCIDGLNPFIVEDFERIDPRKLLGGDIQE
ncbi:TniB family NTP-binding protein [Ruegeria sp. 2012CJ41-6]|uniref:TniB family NTP-binding protein n=1 Tax=Ruegeria spongiae TaxID=2942209 RepID=A0ABT0Q7D0_9RHOB|nr:TniB family NTP-binding protein [Ruegeria spongiae]MCL6285738.1 TniB family NTP-binding protein [Ruegeria spongiae]